MNVKTSLLAHTPGKIIYDCLKERIRVCTLMARDINKIFVAKMFMVILINAIRFAGCRLTNIPTWTYSIVILLRGLSQPRRAW